MRIVANPLNLDYRFQHYRRRDTTFREGADPTAVLFKGRYYLFFSMSGGFWYSDDLIQWQFHENHQIPIHYYAPDVVSIGDYLYFCASRKSKACPIMRSKDPLSDDFEYVNKPFAFLDPAMFHDDDGKVYLYWKQSKGQLYGIEMNPASMKTIGKKVRLVHSDPARIGWERKLSHLVPAAKPVGADGTHIEGGFMTKHAGKYYLQYAAPATELISYGDGVYISDSPLGPFTVQAHNPFSLKPGGFINGAGHGSTMQDKHGNWWHFSTMCIIVNHALERRIGMFPCGFDEDGVLFCNQYLADYPYWIPEGKFEPLSIRPEWMLLSYRKKATASSYCAGHEPELGADESISTSWCAKTGNPGEWYCLDLGKECDVHAVQVNFADVDVPAKKVSRKQVDGEITQKRYIDLDSELHTRFLLESSLDGKVWQTQADKRAASANLCHDLIVNEEGVRARYVRVICQELPYNQLMAISGLRVFGKSEGAMPAAVTANAERTGTTDAVVKWDAVSNATGYVVRYGVSPGKLYSSWTVFGATELAIPFLNAGCPSYYCCVDAFNEVGITAGKTAKIRACQ